MRCPYCDPPVEGILIRTQKAFAIAEDCVWLQNIYQCPTCKKGYYTQEKVYPLIGDI